MMGFVISLSLLMGFIFVKSRGVPSTDAISPVGIPPSSGMVNVFALSHSS